MGGREPVLQAPGAELGVSRGGLLGTAAAVWSAFGPREVAKPSKPARTSASQKPFCDKGYRAFTKPSKKPCTGFLNRVSQVRILPRAPAPKLLWPRVKRCTDDPSTDPRTDPETPVWLAFGPREVAKQLEMRPPRRISAREERLPDASEP